MKDINDIPLVTQVAVFHNKRAFDALVRKYQSQVRRFFMNQTLGDSQLSDDLAQDTFIKAYTHIGTFRAQAGFSTWLYRIAYNVFYDYMRSRKLTDDIENTPLPLLKSQGNDGLKLDIYNAMKVLSSVERTCITLQLIDGLTIDEITEVTRMPSGTVKSHLSRGKGKLAGYLKQNGYDGK
ncbi:MAG: RNA polymerase sigma factor [Prevotella sp.]|nr:RNA polymerase sigma factor [Prevotella sp.]